MQEAAVPGQRESLERLLENALADAWDLVVSFVRTTFLMVCRPGVAARRFVRVDIEAGPRLLGHQAYFVIACVLFALSAPAAVTDLSKEGLAGLVRLTQIGLTEPPSAASALWTVFPLALAGLFGAKLIGYLAGWENRGERVKLATFMSNREFSYALALYGTGITILALVAVFWFQPVRQLLRLEPPVWAPAATVAVLAVMPLGFLVASGRLRMGNYHTAAPLSLIGGYPLLIVVLYFSVMLSAIFRSTLEVMRIPFSGHLLYIASDRARFQREGDFMNVALGIYVQNRSATPLVLDRGAFRLGWRLDSPDSRNAPRRAAQQSPSEIPAHESSDSGLGEPGLVIEPNGTRWVELVGRVPYLRWSHRHDGSDTSERVFPINAPTYWRVKAALIPMLNKQAPGELPPMVLESDWTALSAETK